MKHQQTHPLAEGTLAELREIVEQTLDLPGDAVVRARTLPEFNAAGGRIRRITIGGDR